MEASSNQTPSPVPMPPQNAAGGDRKTNPLPDDKRVYPTLVIANNTNPNRLLAFPLLGYLLKVILMLPLFIMLDLLLFCYFCIMLVLPLIILITGKYPNFAYQYVLFFTRFSCKFVLYLAGISDTYPRNLDNVVGIFEVRFEKPEHVSRFLAFPILGFVIRTVLMIPLYLYTEILFQGVTVSMFVSWFAVLFTKRYPESLYEFTKDTLRVATGVNLYQSYLSDTYPSFKISLNHKAVKIIFLVIGTIMFIFFTVMPTVTQYMYNANHGGNSIQTLLLPHDH